MIASCAEHALYPPSSTFITELHLKNGLVNWFARNLSTKEVQLSRGDLETGRPIAVLDTCNGMVFGKGLSHNRVKVSYLRVRLLGLRESGGTSFPSCRAHLLLDSVKQAGFTLSYSLFTRFLALQSTLGLAGLCPLSNSVPNPFSRCELESRPEYCMSASGTIMYIRL